MNQMTTAILVLIGVPLAVLAYGILGWYKPAQWKKSLRMGYHSRRAERSPEHWMVAQRTYAMLNMRFGAVWCVIAGVETTLLLKGIFVSQTAIFIGCIQAAVYYLAVGYLMEKKLADRFDQADALAGRI